MIDNLFRGLFDTDMTVIITPAEFLTCLGVSLGIGLILAALYQYHTRYTRSFVVTLALLPAVVCVVIMMVNGNVGTGVAVAGTFSLVRFRSAPGTAREICAIFLAMADRTRAAALDARADALLAEFVPRADETFTAVSGKLCNK